MPILNKESFSRIKPPAELKPSDQVFFNKITHEAFLNYDDYFERVILCNSLVWTCSLTGKSGLTFQDALDSEENAREMVKNFPQVLRKPILFVVEMTNRGRMVDLLDDVFMFVKDRYFVGEELDYVHGGKRRIGKLLRIHPLEMGSEKEQKSETSPKGKSKANLEANRIMYEIEDAESGRKIDKLKAKDLIRSRKSLTRDKLKVFLRLATQLRNNLLRVLPSAAEKYKLMETKYEDIQVGKRPIFVSSPLKRVSSSVKEKEKKEKIKEKESDKENKMKSEVSEATQGERAKKKEDKKLRERFLHEWAKPRDDLTVDGMSPLPTFSNIDCGIPHEALADAILVMEFFSAFEHELRVKDYFNSGITLDILERAVTEVDVLGPVIDIFQILLTNLFKLKDAEYNLNYNTLRADDYKRLPITVREAQYSAAKTGRKMLHLMGFRLSQLTLDSFTLSEVLRLHLETSGAPGVKKKQGSMEACEDPALAFCISEAQIMETLRSGSMFELDTSEKLRLLRVIIEQLLCTDGLRDVIEEACETYKTSKVQLRKLRLLAKAMEAQAEGSEGGDKATTVPKISQRELEKKQQELKIKLSNSQKKMMMTYYGEDRAYRRYYLAYSIPAVIVEDDASHIDTECIEGGSPADKMINHTPGFMKQFLQNASRDSCNLSKLTLLKETKENGVRAASPQKMSNGESKMAEKVLNSPDKKVATPIPPRSNDLVSHTTEAYSCSGDLVTCIVHNKANRRSQWTLISSRQQLDEFLSALDDRGVRERSLKVALKADMDNLHWAIDYCPIQVLNRSMEGTIRKTKLPSHYIKPSNLFQIEPQFALELSFREILLELEERISSGGLGYIKTQDRILWRSQIVEILDKVGVKTKAEEINSLKDSSEAAEVMPQLCEALHLVGHCVEKKYLMAPLGEAEPPKKKKTTKEGVNDGVPVQKGIIAAWSRELQPDISTDDDAGLSEAKDDLPSDPPINSEVLPAPAIQRLLNLPKMFLLMYSLERSVMWDRSVSNAACKICRKKSQPDKMLLCDACDRGHHIFCLKPGLPEIPHGDWFCAQCAPSQIVSPKKRPRVEMVPESEDSSDAEENARDDEAGSVEYSDDNQEVCDICDGAGELILCDFCPKAFHLECIELKRVPRGDWMCPKCSKAKSKSKLTLRQQRKSSPQPSAAAVKFRKSLGTVQDVEAFDYSVCSDIVSQLVKSDSAWPFLERVNRKDAPDYYDVIKKPMDFGTIQGKLNDIKYKENKHFVSDVFQIFANCEVYNDPRNEEYKAGKALSTQFCSMLKDVGLRSLVNLRDLILRETEKTVPSKSANRPQLTFSLNGSHSRKASNGDSESSDEENDDDPDEQSNDEDGEQSYEEDNDDEHSSDDEDERKSREHKATEETEDDEGSPDENQGGAKVVVEKNEHMDEDEDEDEDIDDDDDDDEDEDDDSDEDYEECRVKGNGSHRKANKRRTSSDDDEDYPPPKRMP